DPVALLRSVPLFGILKAATPTRGEFSTLSGRPVTGSDSVLGELSTLSTDLSPDRWVTRVAPVTVRRVESVRRSLSGTCHLAVRDRITYACEFDGYVLVDGRRHQHLLGLRRHLGQSGPT